MRGADHKSPIGAKADRDSVLGSNTSKQQNAVEHKAQSVDHKSQHRFYNYFELVQIPFRNTVDHKPPHQVDYKPQSSRRRSSSSRKAEAAAD
eukprot:1143679-Amphidinium_carterae.1